MKRFLFLVPLSAIAAIACSSTNTVVQVVPGPDSGAAIAGGGKSGGNGGDDDDGGATASSCTSARKTLLVPVASVSKGVVKVVGAAGAVTKIFVDGSAGGTSVASTHPRTYIKLDGTRVDTDDNAAFTSSDWDLAFKRVDIFTNGGDSGPGKGAAVLVNKAFADVTKADADGAAQEKFFTGDCEPNKDEAGFLVTTFSGWYDYDDQTHIPKPKANVTFVVKTADASLYKVGLLSYMSTPDGTDGTVTGDFLIQVSKL